MKKDEYLIVRADVLPDVFRKVIDVKNLLDSGEVFSVSSAVPVSYTHLHIACRNGRTDQSPLDAD